MAGLVAELAQIIQKQQGTLATATQATMTKATGDQDFKYMVQSVSDRDLETAWIGECQAISALGGTLPAGCNGSGPGGTGAAGGTTTTTAGTTTASVGTTTSSAALASVTSSTGS